MRIAIVGVGVLFYSLTAQAITWDFNEDGNTQGWQARQGTTAGGPYTPILPSAVVDGVWRIKLSALLADTLNPGAALVSPLIDHDSALFDRVALRFRVLHTRPLEGSVSVSWVNSRNKDLPGHQGSLEFPNENPQESSRLSFYKYSTQILVSLGISESGLDKSNLLEIDSTSVDSSFRADFIKSVGDYDGDGDLDAILVSEWENEISDNFVDSAIPSRGLRVAFNDGTQHLYPTPWYVVIPFSLGPAAAQVSLTIYNTLGQEVRRLDLGELPAGNHHVTWDGRDGQGVELSSGAYLHRLQAGAWSATGKMVKSE